MTRIVFESPADQAGFTQIPNIVLEDGGITAPAKALYALLRRYAWQGDGCHPGQEKLAACLGVTSRTIREYLRELEAQKLVDTKHRQGSTNYYKLLALGLRAKRLAASSDDSENRKQASGGGGAEAGFRGVRKQASDKEDSVKKTQHGEERVGADASDNGDAKLKFGGKPLNAEAWSRTAEVLEEFNRQTGRDLRLVTSGGFLSEAASRIYGRVRVYPDLTLDDHKRIIANTLSSHWWGKERGGIGVVYGPSVFEDNISRKPGRVNSRGSPSAADEALNAAAREIKRDMGWDVLDDREETKA